MSRMDGRRTAPCACDRRSSTPPVRSRAGPRPPAQPAKSDGARAGQSGQHDDDPGDSTMTEDLARLAQRTQEVYERNAARFDAERSKGLHERRWLARFVAGLPAGATILDLGCGAGEPIAAHLLDSGFQVTGVDASRAMIAIARHRWPHGDWRVADMRRLDLAVRFDGILGWNSFFHLTRPEQRALLPRLAERLNPGGRLMLTVGPRDCEEVGRVGDDAVYHASLAPGDYATILNAAGMRMLDFVVEDPECGLQTVLLAVRKGALRG